MGLRRGEMGKEDREWKLEIRVFLLSKLLSLSAY